MSDLPSKRVDSDSVLKRPDDDGLEPIACEDEFSLRRWWRRLWCPHVWEPVGFADFDCSRCGAHR